MSLLHSHSRKRARMGTFEIPNTGNNDNDNDNNNSNNTPGHEVCVIRDFPRHKTSHLRFLTSIYTRTYTSDDPAQRICPILECPREFANKETMCQHLYRCPYMAKGRYWCLDCRKAERISRFHCGKCKRLPSRAASVAKKFFSLLGPKSHPHEAGIAELDGGMGRSVGEEPWDEFLKRSGSATSNAMSKENQDTWGFSPDANLPSSQNANANWDMTFSTTQFTAPGAFPDWNVPPYPNDALELPNFPENSISELPASYEQPVELVAEKSDFLCWDETDDWWLAPTESNTSCNKTSSQVPQLPNTHPQRFLTPLNTQNLCQPSMNQNQMPVDSYGLASPNIISPLSSNSDGNTFNSLSRGPSITVSPTDTESGRSWFTDSTGLTSLNGSMRSTCSRYQGPSKQIDAAPNYSTELTRDFSFSTQNSLSSMDVVSPIESCGLTREFSFTTHSTVSETDATPPAYTWNSSRRSTSRYGPAATPSCQLTHSNSNASSTYSTTSSRSKISSPPALTSQNWTCPQTLAQFLLESLEQHLTRSKSILHTLIKTQTGQNQTHTTIIKDLLDLSPSLVFSIGLDALSSILKGQPPSTYMALFSFTHLAYAAAWAVKDEMAVADLEKLWEDCLVLGEGLQDIEQKFIYEKIVNAIWRPADMAEKNKGRGKTVGNSLTSSSRELLDVLEILSNSVTTTQPVHNIPYPDFMHTVKTQIISQLIQEFYSDGLIEDLIAVEEQAKNGEIKELRSVELALIGVGKNFSISDSVNERYLRKLEKVFNIVYEKQQDASATREAYQLRDIVLLKRLVKDEVFIEDEVSESESNLLAVGGCSVEVPTSIKTNITMFSREAEDTLNRPADEQLPLPPAAAISSSSSTSISTNQTNYSTPNQPVDSPSKYKCPCGYAPKGDDKWKASNLARHKRTQHPPLSNSGKGGARKMFECTFPGCGSTFSRSDNLGQHRREKGHFLPGDRDGEAGCLGIGRRKRRRARAGGSEDGDGGVVAIVGIGVGLGDEEGER